MMTSSWENIVHCLRQELVECGGLLNLFEKQQSALLSQNAAGVLGEVAAIEQQVRTLANRRVSREEFKGKPAGFNRLDVNHDGFIDKADRKAAQAKKSADAAKAKKPPAE